MNYIFYVFFLYFTPFSFGQSGDGVITIDSKQQKQQNEEEQECGNITRKHGEVICSNNNKVGSRCSIRCDDGYQASQPQSASICQQLRHPANQSIILHIWDPTLGFCKKSKTTTTTSTTTTTLPSTTTQAPTTTTNVPTITQSTTAATPQVIPPVKINEENADHVSHQLFVSLQQVYDEGVENDETFQIIVDHLSNFANSNVSLNNEIIDNIFKSVGIISTTTANTTTKTTKGIPQLIDDILLNYSGGMKYVSSPSNQLRGGVADVDLHQEGGLSFSFSDGFDETSQPSPMIEIPANFPIPGQVRIAFTAFDDATLFSSEHVTSIGRSGKVDLNDVIQSRVINSAVIGANVNGTEIDQLQYPIIITLTRYTDDVVDELKFDNSTSIRGIVSNPRCVFFTDGDWSTEGCDTIIEDDVIKCQCYHLTSFAILMDFNKVSDDYILDILSYIGTTISILGLLITIITHLMFKALRGYKSKKILVHFCTALLGMYLTYIFGLSAQLPQNQTQCIASGFFMQYFLTCVFVWMFVEVIDMYFLFVKVWSDVEHFLAKMTILGWGFPLLISVTTLVSHVLITNHAVDGARIYPDYVPLSTICWLTSIGVYWTIFIPLGALLIVNCVLFSIVVYNVTCKREMNKSSIGGAINSRHIKAKEHIINAFAIMLLSGPSWLFGFLINIDPVEDGITRRILGYLFVIFNSLQGLWIFIVFVVRPKKVRNLWAGLFKPLLSTKKIATRTFSYGSKTGSTYTKNTTARTSSSVSPPSSPRVMEAPATSWSPKHAKNGSN